MDKFIIQATKSRPLLDSKVILWTCFMYVQQHHYNMPMEFCILPKNSDALDRLRTQIIFQDAHTHIPILHRSSGTTCIIDRFYKHRAFKILYNHFSVRRHMHPKLVLRCSYISRFWCSIEWIFYNIFPRKGWTLFFLKLSDEYRAVESACISPATYWKILPILLFFCYW